MRLVALLVALVILFAAWAHVHDSKLTAEACGQSMEVLTTEQRGIGVAKAIGETIRDATRNPDGVDNKTLLEHLYGVWRVLSKWWDALTRTAKGQTVTLGPGIDCDPPKDCTDANLLVSFKKGDGFTAEQRSIAATAVRVADEMGIPRRGKVVILATGFQESGVRNLNYGDRDSLGWLQQRGGWGTAKQRRDPEYAARKFFQSLKRVDGWQRMPVTVAAQRVQISGTPDAYAAWEDDAERLLVSVGESPAPSPRSPSGDCPASPVATPSGWDRMNPQTVSQAVAYMERMASSRTPIRVRMCLHYVGMAYGRPSTLAGTAYGQWLIATGRRPGDRSPPRGALMFWGPTRSNPAGHVAISLGNGRAASTDWPTAGLIGVGSVKALIDWPGGEYLGWAEPNFKGGTRA